MPARSVASLVVVTHNSTSFLDQFAASLPNALCGIERHEVLVVDSGSTDGSLDEFTRAIPGAIPVDLGGNRGFAAGFNTGVQATTLGGPVVVLNPDIRPMPGSFAHLIDGLSNPSVGISVPRLVDERGKTQYSLRRTPTLLRALGEAVLGGARAGRFRLLGEVVRDPHDYERESDVDWATGAVMCVARECLEATGPWNESFFLYSEETDFALRARDKGFRVRYLPSAVVTHTGGEAHTSTALFALLNVNRVRLYATRHGAVTTNLFRLALALGLAARSITGSRPHQVAVRALFTSPDLVVQRARNGTSPADASE